MPTGGVQNSSNTHAHISHLTCYLQQCSLVLSKRLSGGWFTRRSAEVIQYIIYSYTAAVVVIDCCSCCCRQVHTVVPVTTRRHREWVGGPYKTYILSWARRRKASPPPPFVIIIAIDRVTHWLLGWRVLKSGTTDTSSSSRVEGPINQSLDQQTSISFLYTTAAAVLWLLSLDYLLFLLFVVVQQYIILYY